MTAAQIKAILTAKGFSTDTWTTLNDGNNYFSTICMEGDDNIFVIPTSNLFYFDSTEKLLYVNKMDGKVKTTMVGMDKPNEVTFKGKKYYINSVNYSTETDIGNIVEIHDFKHITGFITR